MPCILFGTSTRKQLQEAFIQTPIRYISPTCIQCMHLLCIFVIFPLALQAIGPGWRGAVQILSTVPTVEWVLLGSGESNKG